MRYHIYKISKPLNIFRRWGNFFTSDFRFLTSVFRLPTSDFRRAPRANANRVFIGVLSIFILITGFIGLSAHLFKFYFGPVGDSAETKIIHITPGMDSYQIARSLVDERLIRNPFAFRAFARFSNSSRQLKAGKYELNPQLNTFQILKKLVHGDVIMSRFVVPEGFTISQVIQIWEQNGFGKASDFEQATQKRFLFTKYGIEASTLEGYLFPDTYQFVDGMRAAVVVERMIQTFYQKFTVDLQQEAAKLGLSVHEAVTLASIIEKEAQVADERQIISAVFHNRLRRGWRLDADPTVLYAFGNPKRPLTSGDLNIDSPYNTYRYRGLPPGPICNPGLASLIAAVRPAATPYMYFVAMGNGTHYFSHTLREHQRAINKAKRQSD